MGRIKMSEGLTMNNWNECWGGLHWFRVILELIKFSTTVAERTHSLKILPSQNEYNEPGIFVRSVKSQRTFFEATFMSSKRKRPLNSFKMSPWYYENWKWKTTNQLMVWCKLLLCVNSCHNTKETFHQAYPLRQQKKMGELINTCFVFQKKTTV